VVGGDPQQEAGQKGQDEDQKRHLPRAPTLVHRQIRVLPDSRLGASPALRQSGRLKGGRWVVHECKLGALPSGVRGRRISGGGLPRSVVRRGIHGLSQSSADPFSILPTTPETRAAGLEDLSRASLGALERRAEASMKSFCRKGHVENGDTPSSSSGFDRRSATRRATGRRRRTRRATVGRSGAAEYDPGC
jgi:hypothetical protein